MNGTLKKQVHDFWNTHPCGNDTASSAVRTKAYYDEIETFRYKNEPVILSFAQFGAYRGKKVLEVGVGMGTDFQQWVKNGAQASGIDLTEAGIAHVKERLALYGLSAQELRIGDAEALPYADNTFDLVYSWGVIMHTPDTEKALAEIVRVMKPGGEGKLMVYNRFSLNTLYLWLKHALLKGRPWKSFSWCLAHFQESAGTKAFTISEVRRMLARHSLADVRIETHRTYADTLEHSRKTPVRFFGRLVSTLLPFRSMGWFITIQFYKS